MPVLEVYAPVRERGTDRIIAVAETYEIAVDLKREVLFDQLVIWLAVGATTLTIVVLNFGMASTGSVERSSLVRRIRELSRLRGESDQRRERISAANLHMTEVGERSLGQVGAELFDGPAQLVALALLKLSSLNDVVSMAKSAMPTHSDESAEDLATIKAALTSTLRHINRIATRLLPPDIDELSTSATIVSAARRHEERTGLPLRYEACDLPDLLPYPFKASLFRFALEALDLSAGQRAQSQSMRGCRKDDNIVIEIMGGHSPPLGAGSPELAGLRDRVEALGGIFSVRSTPAGEVTFTAEFSYSEVARG